MSAPKRTPELVSKARKLRLKGLGYVTIARALGVSQGAVYYWLNKDRADARLERQRNRTRKERWFNPNYICVNYRPPEADYLARLAEIPPDTRTLSQRLLGDPVPGRSALDRRRESHERL